MPLCILLFRYSLYYTIANKNNRMIIELIHCGASYNDLICGKSILYYGCYNSIVLDKYLFKNMIHAYARRYRTTLTVTVSPYESVQCHLTKAEPRASN